jgi:hypothetical protein
MAEPCSGLQPPDQPGMCPDPATATVLDTDGEELPMCTRDADPKELRRIRRAWRDRREV